jgi:thiamine transporter
MIALSTVLSVFKLFEMPYGGSITLASFLPIVVVAYRHGSRAGLSSALCASLIQLLLGLKNFSYFTSWQSIVALALFDYVFAFAVFGLAGIFKGIIKKQNLSLVAGAVLSSVVRYICHVISGATIWAGLSIPTEAALIYSLSYNATYMIPESIILVLTCAYLGSALDLTRQVPTRLRSEKTDPVASYVLAGAGFTVLGALIADTVLIFSKLQDGDSGEFMITALSEVNWLAFGIITGAALLVAAALVFVAKRRIKKL